MRFYDDFSNIVSETNTRGLTTTYGYSTTGLLISQLDPASETESRYTSYTRNAQGSVTQVQVRANQANGVILSQVNFDQWDAYGHPRRTTIKDDDRNAVYLTEYGAAYHYAYPTEYQYDLSGRRLAMKDRTGTTGYEYHADTKHLIKVTYPDGKSISYTNNDMGRRKKMVDPFGYTMEYAYDQRSRLSDVFEPGSLNAAKYEYYKNGLIKQIRWGNSNVSEYEYDGTRMSTLTHRKAQESCFIGISIRMMEMEIFQDSREYRGKKFLVTTMAMMR